MTTFLDTSSKLLLQKRVSSCSQNETARKLYALSIWSFIEWCESHEADAAGVDAEYVARWVRELEESYSASTVKLRLSAVSKMFHWLQEIGIRPDNPARGVRGPSNPSRLKTSPLLVEQVAELIDSIDGDDLSGARDKALIATLFYSAAPISVILAIKLSDLSGNERKLHINLSGMGPLYIAPKELTVLIFDYVCAGRLKFNSSEPLFQTVGRGTQHLSSLPMAASNVHSMIKRRARKAGLPDSVSSHTFRATAISSRLVSETPEAIAESTQQASVRSIKRYLKQ